MNSKWSESSSYGSLQELLLQLRAARTHYVSRKLVATLFVIGSLIAGEMPAGSTGHVAARTVQSKVGQRH